MCNNYRTLIMSDGEIKILIELMHDEEDKRLFAALQSKNNVEAAKNILRYLFFKNEEYQSKIVQLKASLDKLKQEEEKNKILLDDSEDNSGLYTLMRKIQLAENNANRKSVLTKEIKNNVMIVLLMTFLVALSSLRVLPVGVVLSIYTVVLTASFGYSYLNYKKATDARNVQNMKQKLFTKPGFKQMIQSKLQADLSDITEELNDVTTQIKELATTSPSSNTSGMSK